MKPQGEFQGQSVLSQPPSGGCVLKPAGRGRYEHRHFPAAFRRLCVETPTKHIKPSKATPAAFRRLCVETTILEIEYHHSRNQPPSGGCVLKPIDGTEIDWDNITQPPSGGCVLKPIDGTEIDWDNITQPPSGGCVLKRSDLAGIRAALTQPPSGGCVLKLKRW